MKSSFLFTMICLLSGLHLHGQEPGFRATLSRDTVLLGNYLAVTFSLENASGESFQAPLFEDFDVVGGPNTSSSFSMINGKTTRRIAYTFYIQPREVGSFYVEPASIEVEGKALETEPLEVIVMPNPEGVVEKPESSGQPFPFRLEERNLLPRPAPAPEAAPKKKRRTYKM